MKSKFLTLGVSAITALFFSGCVKNQLITTNFNYDKERAKVKVFVNNDGTTYKEKSYLKVAKKEFLSFTPEILFEKKDNIEKFYNSFKTTKSNNLEVFGELDGIRVNIKGIKKDEYSLLIGKVLKSKINKKKNKLSFDFDIVNRKLVSKKTYKNEADILVDYLRISEAQFGKLGIRIGKKMGYSSLVLDANEMRIKKKLVLRTLNDLYPIKPKFENALTKYGFTVVDNKEGANKCFRLATGSFGLKRVIEKNIPEKTEDVDFSIAQTGMNYASAKGSSDLKSMGVGLLLAGLNIAGKSSSIYEDKIKYKLSAIVKDCDGGKRSAMIYAAPEFFKTVKDIDIQYKQNSKDVGIKYTRVIETFTYFLENNKMLRTKAGDSSINLSKYK